MRFLHGEFVGGEDSPPLPDGYNPDTDDPAFDYYPDARVDPQPVWRERPARQDVIRHALGGEK